MIMFRKGRSRSAIRSVVASASTLMSTVGVMSLALCQAYGQAAPPAPAPTPPPPDKSTHYTDWPQLGGGVLRNGVSDETVTPPLSLLWRFTAAPQSQDRCAPIIAAGTIFYAARGEDANGPGTLFALDPTTGSEKWRAKLVGANLFSTAPTYDNGTIYIGASSGSVYAYNATNGQEIVHYQTPRPIASSPTVVSGVLYFGSDDGTLYALDPQSGSRVWRSIYKAGDAINSAPVVANGFVFITTSGDTVQAIKQATGIGRWTFRLPYRILPDAPIFADSTLYVPAGPRLYALQPTSGSTRWASEAPNDILTTPVSANGVVYVLSRDTTGDGARVSAFFSGNGKPAWKKPVLIAAIPGAAPTVSGNVMYIPTVRNMILAISLDDGHVLWQFHIDSSVNRAGVTPRATTSLTAPIAISGGAIYALTDDGALSSFRPDAPDKSGPTVYNMYPSPAERVNGAPPLILATYVTDPGSGVDPKSLKMTLDDKDIVPTYDPTRSLILYKTKSTGKIIDQPLSNGRHSASVTISDWKGNITTQTWSFVVDNTVPQYTKGVPPPATTTGSGRGNGNGRGKGGFGGPGFGGPGG